MIITIASGKGGTGKTTFAVNLAYALAASGNNVRLLDADVEEPNDHLFVRPEFTATTAVEVPRPEWHADRCTACGKCAEACRYNALAVVKDQLLVFNDLCHACGVCTQVCPEQALSEKSSVIGRVEAAPAHQPFYFAHGILNVGEPLAPSVVKEVKNHLDPEAVNIIDAAPGTACPVVEAVEGADIAILVTEPTPFGLNDLELAAGLTLQAGVPTGIVINRSEGDDNLIEEYADRTGIPIVGRIPFKRAYAETYSRGDILAEIFPDLKQRLLDIYEHIRRLAGTPPPQLIPLPEPVLQPDATPTHHDGGSAVQRELVVISGKGGTGKTTVLSSFAMLAQPAMLADNDVDAADLHLLLQPAMQAAQDFKGGAKAIVNAEQCIGCGQCISCHFGAITINGPATARARYTCHINELACEGCGLCEIICPVQAIRMEEQVTGQWYLSNTAYGPMTHARLGIAEENTGKLVTCVRQEAAQEARRQQLAMILGDGPPGTSCPVIASVSGADLALIVTEPTVSGVHDLKRVLQLTGHFQVPALIIINKADLNPEQGQLIRAAADAAHARVIAEVPFDREVHHALMAGKTLIEWNRGPAVEAVRAAWKFVEKELLS